MHPPISRDNYSRLDQYSMKLTCYIYCISITLAFYFSQPIHPQDAQKEICIKPSINLISEISSANFSNQEKGFFSVVLDLITGEDKLTIVKPFSIYAATDGSLYFLDQDNKSLILIDEEENEIENLFPDDLQCESLVGLCSTESGLLITDSQNNKILKYEYESEEVREFNISLDQPTGIAYIKSKNEIWVCETKNHRIIRLDKYGNKLGTIGQRGITLGEFNFPTFIWADNKGKVYVNDSMNFRVQIFSEDGSLLSAFGKAGDGSGDFARPKGIATDSYGHIYVADALFNNIQVFNQEGQLLYTFGERGTDQGQFWLPAGIYISRTNTIYIADSFNSRIQIFQLECDENSKN